MKKYGTFLHWWIIFTLICIGIVLLFITDLISTINEVDITKLSLLIGVLFLGSTVRIGLSTYKLCKEDSPTKETLDNHRKTSKLFWFIADTLLSVGMVGTVIGFIYMLSISFGNISVENTAALRAALQTMGTGMSTALYTTAAGLICSIILKLQLYPFTRLIESKERR